MSDCSKHKKEVAGISDMKELAGMIGDLHYETLLSLLKHLSLKLNLDGVNDKKNGRIKLGNNLMYASENIDMAAIYMDEVWRISKPFMKG